MAAFSTLAAWSAWLHVMLAVPFGVGIVVMAVLWLRQNVPERIDWIWLRRGGGMLPNQQGNPPARRFNAGQKIVFWGVILGGLALIISGTALMFPFYWSGYAGMETVQITHAVIALLMIGLIIGHIYIGTIGMVGAFDAMWTGNVDRNWAKEHHDLWLAGMQGSRDDAPAGHARNDRTTGTYEAWSTFGLGICVAVVAAACMLGIYLSTSVSTTRQTGTASVHLSGSTNGNPVP